MDLSVKTGQPDKIKTNAIAVAVYEGKTLSPAATALNEAQGNLIDNALKLGDITGKAGEVQALISVDGKQRVILFGLGNAEATTPDVFRKGIQAVFSAVTGSQSKSLTLCLEGISVDQQDDAWIARQIGELSATALYTFNQFKSKDKQTKIKLDKVQLHTTVTEQANTLKSALGAGKALGNGMDLARTLGNLPGNVCHPSYLAAQARKLGKETPKLSIKVIEEKEMKALGMGALLSVSIGSDQPAKLIIMEYKGGKKSDQPHVLVGKGITFDTGGISLKPGANMDQMKFDMCGAASVFGTMKAIVDMELPLNVIGVVTAAENMPSGKASRPGDIVKTMSGQTVEILNTDAEGRLVLCDALTYVERFKPASVIDIATLTGACLVALGAHASGMLGNNDELIDHLKLAAESTQDKVWQLPLWDEYQQQLDTPFADMANIGGPKAGTITAACFLSRFTKKYSWAHLDIAGTAWIDAGKQKGATGRPVPLLVEYLCQQAAR